MGRQAVQQCYAAEAPYKSDNVIAPVKAGDRRGERRQDGYHAKANGKIQGKDVVEVDLR
ncbi:hypothetical protein D3C87_2084670 [compost metagenome]